MCLVDDRRCRLDHFSHEEDHPAEVVPHDEDERVVGLEVVAEDALVVRNRSRLFGAGLVVFGDSEGGSEMKGRGFESRQTLIRRAVYCFVHSQTSTVDFEPLVSNNRMIQASNILATFEQI